MISGLETEITLNRNGSFSWLKNKGNGLLVLRPYQCPIRLLQKEWFMSVGNTVRAWRPLIGQEKAFIKTNKTVSRVSDLANLLPNESHTLEQVAKQYKFQATEYYLDLINWNDPNDPLKRLIVPHLEELDDWGTLDACDEASNTQLNGVQHKYPDTALMLVTNTCATLCRYCFRKRLFLDGNHEVSPNIAGSIEYISNHKEITDVLLTGGDPLTLPTRKLEKIFVELGRLDHVKAVRLGSKVPAFDPWRLTEDKRLQSIITDFLHTGKTLYLIAHFDHPREITQEAITQLRLFRKLGVVMVNQCPILRGINDDPDILSELYKSLSSIGVAPYYLFQGRPTKGNAMFRVPIVRGYKILTEAVNDLSGLAKRVRFVMSHATGKIEVLGVDNSHIYMKYHRPKYSRDKGRFMIFNRDDKAYWLDQLIPSDSTV